MAPQDLSILQYNIQQLPYQTCLLYLLTGFHGLRSNLSTNILPHIIGKLGADVIVLNEVFLKSLYEPIRQTLKEYGYQYSTPVLMQNNWWRFLSGGVAILSKYPILETKEYMFQSCQFPEFMASKGVVYVKIEKQNQPLHLFGLHLNSSTGPHFERDRPCREMQIFELLKFYQKLKIPKDEPVILAGDFNVNRYYLEEYHAMLEMLQVHEPEYQGNSYTYDELENPWVDRGEGRQWLDYIFVKQAHLNPKKLTNQVLILKSDGYDLSDHYAVLGEIEFNPTSKGNCQEKELDDQNEQDLIKDIIIKVW